MGNAAQGGGGMAMIGEVVGDVDNLGADVSKLG